MSLTRAQLARAARILGAKGGRATARRLTADERSAFAKRASDARWLAERTQQQEKLKRINARNVEFWAKRGGMPE